MSVTRVKDIIRTIRRDDKPATRKEVKNSIAKRDNGVDLMQSYEQAKQFGEIYEYPEGGDMVVKITDEVIA